MNRKRFHDLENNIKLLKSVVTNPEEEKKYKNIFKSNLNKMKKEPQQAHNVPRTSPYDPILVKTSRTIGQKQDVLGF